MYRVHHFPSSLEAYKASLEEGPVREGDVLVITPEGIVGIASTDPIAVTVANGALKDFPTMGRDMLMAELAHDEAEIGRAVNEALRHRLPVADQFLSFAGPSHLLLSSEVRLTLTQRDIMVTTDALDRRAASLRARADTLDPESSAGLFVRHALVQIAEAHERFAGAPRPNR